MSPYPPAASNSRTVRAHHVHEHPWPTELPAGHTGIVGGGPRRLTVTLVEPTLIVEVEADQAHEHRRWRHLTQLRRIRPDLDPQEIARHDPIP
jgi:hypothetical protein